MKNSNSAPKFYLTCCITCPFRVQCPYRKNQDYRECPILQHATDKYMFRPSAGNILPKELLKDARELERGRDPATLN